MINCGSCFCEQKKKRKKTETHPNTKFLPMFQVIGTKC